MITLILLTFDQKPSLWKTWFYCFLIYSDFLVACSQKKLLLIPYPMKFRHGLGYDKFDEGQFNRLHLECSGGFCDLFPRVNWKWNIKERAVDYATPDTSLHLLIDLSIDQLTRSWQRIYAMISYWLIDAIHWLGFWYTYEEEANIPSQSQERCHIKVLTIVYNSGPKRNLGGLFF